MIKEIETNITIHEYFVEGMHCSACELVIEKKLSKHESIKHVKANLDIQKVLLHADNSLDRELLHNQLNDLLKNAGYKLHISKETIEKPNYKGLVPAFLIALIFIGLFIILQKAGLVNLLNTSKVTYPFVFLIGIVASLSSCMAVVGGLVLSISSAFSKSSSKSLPLILFHASRVVGFFILGGLIGLLGSAFTLSITAIAVIDAILFAVMFILGMNLLDVFPIFRKFQFRFKFRMPGSIGNSIANTSYKNILTPVLLGSSTFFLPCGFTQSMQVYSLSTGTFIGGALTMFVFALGTLPMLAALSFASLRFSTTLQSKLFFRTAGFIVIFFAIINLLGGLTTLGIIKPIFSF